MGVKIEVDLPTGASMGYERTGYQVADVSLALTELDKGYSMLRSWLLAQLSPAEQAKFRGSPAAQDSRPRPEERSVRETVRETIQDDAKRGRWTR